MFLCLSVAGATRSFAQPRIAYVWGNQPSEAEYAPHPNYLLRDEISVRISRQPVGRYRITLGPLVDGQGNVQVSAYGATTHSCQVESWGRQPGGLGPSGATVLCFDSQGRPVDSRFTLLAVQAGGATNIAYVWANQATSASYVPTGAYAYAPWSSAGDIRITRSEIGRYRVRLSPAILTTGANVQVTAYGTAPRRCGVLSWGGGVADVGCTNFSGVPADATFSLLAVKPDDHERFSFTWANDPTAVGYTPVASYTHALGANVRIEHTLTGRYWVPLNGPIGNIQTTAYGAPGVSCHPVEWSQTRVEIACNNSAGYLADSRFTLLATRHPIPP